MLWIRGEVSYAVWVLEGEENSKKKVGVNWNDIMAVVRPSASFRCLDYQVRNEFITLNH